MEINFSKFEESLSKRDKKDLYCRPLTSLLNTHFPMKTVEHISNISSLTKPKQNQGYTTRYQSNDKKAYRNVRSASIYQTLSPHLSNKPCRLQIVNNACLKKISYYQRGPFSRGSSVYNINQSVSESDFTKKENCLPKYQCKKLRALRRKSTLNNDSNNEEQLWGKSANVGIIGTKLL